MLISINQRQAFNRGCLRKNELISNIQAENKNETRTGLSLNEFTSQMPQSDLQKLAEKATKKGLDSPPSSSFTTQQSAFPANQQPKLPANAKTEMPANQQKMFSPNQTPPFPTAQQLLNQQPFSHNQQSAFPAAPNQHFQQPANHPEYPNPWINPWIMNPYFHQMNHKPMGMGEPVLGLWSFIL